MEHTQTVKQYLAKMNETKLYNRAEAEAMIDSELDALYNTELAAQVSAPDALYTSNELDQVCNRVDNLLATGQPNDPPEWVPTWVQRTRDAAEQKAALIKTRQELRTLIGLD